MGSRGACQPSRFREGWRVNGTYGSTRVSTALAELDPGVGRRSWWVCSEAGNGRWLDGGWGTYAEEIHDQLRDVE